ncbi:hypothetical protein OYC64_005488 [Pagothenia borchgrevinki]
MVAVRPGSGFLSTACDS